MKTNGSCLCGKVRFVVEGDFEHFFLCHCQRCRKDTGSAHAANLFSTSAMLTWLSGEDEVNTYQVPGSRHVKSFCSHCGSAVPNVQMEGRLTVVPAGSLDDDVSIRPDAHICVASKANWDEELDLIPKLEGMPGN
ncbi:GFA family protein [Teredinibacter sp. KSP-S5-2]|uniref:GFA family protein n=1 Tax=Teredinibacter sp. KSP-S5-2 TaxID=3034506 RepID=UPI002934DFCC|nr:GFA family protein [Teredinibacter sp. KSP-S5-2]WNO09936.1 GFA family protein [Teredinibacter sp. KSP-S5-2]